jgi:hypothetical protein
MIASTDAPRFSPCLDRLRAGFEALLPRIEQHARIAFRDVRCPDRKAEAVAETVGLAWTWYCRLAEKGRDAAAFASALATLATRSARSGRRVCGAESANDVLSKHAQARHGFRVSSLPSSPRNAHENLYGDVLGQRQQDVFEERLQQNAVTPIPDQVQFRIDFPAWLRTLTARERRIIRAMLREERTKDLSRRFHLSPGRISQLRAEFKQGWRRFCGDAATEAGAAVASGR